MAERGQPDFSDYAESVPLSPYSVREPMGRRAVEQLNVLLRDALPEAELAKLARLGAQLSEDQALVVALSD